MHAADEKKATALLLAAMKEHLKSVWLLCNSGALLDDRNAFGYTQLMLAAKGGHLDVVAELCQRGADPAAAMPNGATALSLAAAHPEVAEFLSRRGA